MDRIDERGRKIGFCGWGSNGSLLPSANLHPRDICPRGAPDAACGSLNPPLTAPGISTGGRLGLPIEGSANARGLREKFSYGDRLLSSRAVESRSTFNGNLGLFEVEKNFFINRARGIRWRNNSRQVLFER